MAGIDVTQKAPAKMSALEAALKSAKDLHAKDDIEDPFVQPKINFGHAVLGSHRDLAEHGGDDGDFHFQGPVSFLSRHRDGSLSQTEGVAPRGARVNTGRRQKEDTRDDDFASQLLDDPFLASGGDAFGIGSHVNKLGSQLAGSTMKAAASAQQYDPFAKHDEKEPLLSKKNDKKKQLVLTPKSHMALPMRYIPLSFKKTWADEKLKHCLLMTTFMPWSVFISTCALFIAEFHIDPYFTLVVATVACLICIGAWRSSVQDGHKMQAYAISLCLLAIIIGSMLSFYNYAVNLQEFYAFVDHRQYSNVWPSESAEAHRDAAAIVFAEGARVDLRLHSITASGLHTYCVAPITMRETDTGTPDVQYWAVGKDCCTESSFACGDVHDVKARAGVAVQNQTNPLYTAVEKREVEYYAEAVRRGMLRFGIVSTAARPFFLRWTSDIDRTRNEFLRSGIIFLVVTSLAYLVVCFVVALGSPEISALFLQDEDDSGSA